MMPQAISYIFADSFLHWNCIYLILHIDPEVRQVKFHYHIAKCLSISSIDCVPTLLSLNGQKALSWQWWRELASDEKRTGCSALIWRSEVRMRYNF